MSERHPDRIVPTDATEDGVTIGEVRITRSEWATLRIAVYPRTMPMYERTVQARYDGLTRDGKPVFTPWPDYGFAYLFDMLGVSVRREVRAS